MKKVWGCSVELYFKQPKKNYIIEKKKKFTRVEQSCLTEKTSQFYINDTGGTNRNVVKIISIELVVGQLAN